MANEITEEDVRKDVMVFANVLLECGMTDDPLGVVDAWIREWRSGALVAFRAADGSLYWKGGSVNTAQTLHPIATHELNRRNAKRQLWGPTTTLK